MLMILDEHIYALEITDVYQFHCNLLQSCQHITLEGNSRITTVRSINPLVKTDVCTLVVSQPVFIVIFISGMKIDFSSLAKICFTNETFVSFSFLQSDKFSHNASLLDSGLVQQTAAMLANATLHTEKFYGSDVKVAYRLTQNLLQHESNQQGFNLTATQDVHFTEVNNHMPSIMETVKNTNTVTGIQNTA